MSIECIKDANLEETGFKVVRFNELKNWRRTAWSTGRNIRKFLPKWNTA